MYFPFFVSFHPIRHQFILNQHAINWDWTAFLVAQSFIFDGGIASQMGFTDMLTSIMAFCCPQAQQQPNVAYSFCDQVLKMGKSKGGVAIGPTFGLVPNPINKD